MYLPSILNLTGVILIGIALFLQFTEGKKADSDDWGLRSTLMMIGGGILALAIDFGMQYYLKDFMLTNVIGFGILILIWIVSKLRKGNKKEG